MLITKSHLRWITFFAAIPFLYFLFTRTLHNWLYFTSAAVLMATTVGMLVLEWRAGERKKVKNKLIAFGIYTILFAVLLIYQLYFSK